MTPPVLYGAPSAHTSQFLNDEELATGLDKFWVSTALTIRIQNYELIIKTSVTNIKKNCEDAVNKSRSTFDGWTDQKDLPKGWKANQQAEIAEYSQENGWNNDVHLPQGWKPKLRNPDNSVSTLKAEGALRVTKQPVENFKDDANTKDDAIKYVSR